MKKKKSFRHLLNSLNHLNFRRIEECSTLIHWLEPKAGEHILDIGCGDGYYDMLISRSGAKVVGLDIQEKPLAQAQKLYQDHLCQFLYMNAEEMNIDNASFDKVVSFCVIEHFQNEDKAIHNIARALKPGGWFVFSADSLSNPEITEEERKHHRKRYAVNTFYTVEYLQEKLKRSGFNIEKTRYILTTPYALALARFSWKLDKLPKALGVFSVLGYLSLFALWKLNSYFPEQLSIPSQGGLTLLVCAKKTQEPF